MRRYVAAGVLGLLLLAAFRAMRGDRLEVRGADVYTGPSVANGEVGLVGNQAILARKVNEGSGEGVNLSGPSVAAGGQAQCVHRQLRGLASRVLFLAS